MRLTRSWGYRTLKKQKMEIIHRYLNRKDVFGVLLTYQSAKLLIIHNQINYIPATQVMYAKQTRPLRYAPREWLCQTSIITGCRLVLYRQTLLNRALIDYRF